MLHPFHSNIGAACTVRSVFMRYHKVTLVMLFDAISLAQECITKIAYEGSLR